ncbi:MAG TPA: glycosyl hydrolase [Planctomycetales bacterium]|nr:glycosyl hydrolase [Planctomycetales bacterium]
MMRTQAKSCPGKYRIAVAIAGGLVLALAAVRPATAQPPAKADPRDDASPWGIASGAEWSGDYPKFNPMLQKAGVGWLRLFPEWQVIQPKKDQWNWKSSDAMAADARANNIHLLVCWAYLAPWASADGGTRKFPIKDIRYWRDYITGTVERYQKDVKYWEVWNEFNGSFGDSKNKVKDYAELVVTAYDAGKKIDPTAKIGLSVANFDVGFLDAVIKAGAADHFDFICVHPYENLGAVAEGGEVGYLSLAGNLRKMLAANKQRKDIPLWITEIGFQAPTKPDAKGDAEQADMLAKAYVLSIVQGFERIFWFEARGPAYGKGTDHGIIRPDWTPRPAYDALKTMTAVLGQQPRYLGWLDLGKGGYGFLFQGQKGNVLAAWSPAGKEYKVKFDAEVAVTDLAGKQSPLPAGQELVLTQRPVFISDVPADLAKQAQGNDGKPYPWGGDYANAKVVTCRLGAANTEDGLKQVNPKTTVVVNEQETLVESYRRPDFANPALKNEGRYVYFRVDPQFVPFGTKELEITIVAKRLASDKEAGMNLTYESMKGYTGAQGWWTIPKDDKWHENTWKISDANFVGQWGWNFRFDANGSPNEFLIKEVRVKKAAGCIGPAKAK